MINENMRKKYPYYALQYEWERCFPWVTEAFEELDKLFFLKSTEYEVYFDRFGIHVIQRGKASTFAFNSDRFPTIKRRYAEICSMMEPFVPETVDARIKIICKHFGKPEDIEELKNIWLEGDKNFVIDFLYLLVISNDYKQSEKRCDLMLHLLDELKY